MMTSSRNFQQAFSLVELAVVLALAGMILGSGLIMAINLNEQQRIEDTRDRLDYIMQAIDDFVDANGYIPCPADGTDLLSDSAFGFGTASGNPLSAVTTCTAANLLDAGASNVMIGMVPVSTLHIPPEYSMDGWNRRFTYAADEDITFVGTAGSNGYVDNTTPTLGNVEVDTYSASNVAYQPAASSTNAVVLVMSHGQNSYGAWPGRGGSRISVGGGSAYEDENDDADNAFIQSLRSASFDDIVAFRTKWQLNGVEE